MTITIQINQKNYKPGIETKIQQILEKATKSEVTISTRKR